MTERLLILGGGKSQMPFILCANALGLDTLVVDSNADAPGKRVASEFICRSIRNANQLIPELEGKSIAGVICYSSHSDALRTASVLTERFGCCGPSPARTNLLLDKTLWQTTLEKAGFRTPQSAAFIGATNGKGQSRFPLVAKPQSGVGSTGVRLIRNAEELKQALFQGAAEGGQTPLLLQEYVAGPEYNISGLVSGDEIMPLVICEKHVDPIWLHPLGFMSVSDDRTIWQELARISQECIFSLGLRNSAFSIDLKMTESGPVILDVGILLDAKLDRLLEFIGSDFYGDRIRTALGEPVGTTGPLADSHGLAFIYGAQKGQLPPAHILESTSRFLDQGLRLEWELGPGASVSPPASLSDIMGWLLAAPPIANEGFDGLLYRAASLSKSLLLAGMREVG